MQIDVTEAGAWLAAIVPALAGFGIYLRRERVANASAHAVITERRAESAVHGSHTGEIENLRKRITALDTAFVEQAATLSAQAKRISALEATHIGVGSHLDNLILCEFCTATNASLMEAIKRAMAKASEEDD